MPLDFQEIKISWLGHDAFRIDGPPTIYIDPYQLKKAEPKADIILISHDHYDHLSLDDVKKVWKDETTVIAADPASRQLDKAGIRNTKSVKPGDTVEVAGVKVEAVPAYNINKFRSPGRVFHDKGDGYVGFVIEVCGVRVYHTGDSDNIPEIAKIKCDVALLPVSGTYVMTAEEAAEAAKVLKPKLTLPMHYGSIVGDERAAKRFKELCPYPVEILKPE